MPGGGRVLVLGPHPDDPETVAITCRILLQSGCEVRYAIVSLSPSGVEDAYARARAGEDFVSLQEKKRKIRREEQTRAAEMFPLSPDRLAFLGIEEGKELDSPEHLTRIKEHLESVEPDIVILPNGKDPNRTHAWVHQAFRKCARDLASKTEKPIVALYNEDPKTIEIRKDLFVLFGEGGAHWKGALLRAHDSQQERNLYRRGMGFDERILRMNQSSFRLFGGSAAPARSAIQYAEVFEIELFDGRERMAGEEEPLVISPQENKKGAI